MVLVERRTFEAPSLFLLRQNLSKSLGENKVYRRSGIFCDIPHEKCLLPIRPVLAGYNIELLFADVAESPRTGMDVDVPLPTRLRDDTVSRISTSMRLANIEQSMVTLQGNSMADYDRKFSGLAMFYYSASDMNR
jgi:hypothetical protein